MTKEEIGAEVAKIRWFHRIDLGQGIITPGVGDSPAELACLGMPADLSGKTVLDIGAWNGFYSFEAERRGARRVLATDSFVWSHPHYGQEGFNLARRVLGSKVEDKHLDVMDLSPEKIGTFDVVLFLGVLYHMRHPLLALERAASVTAEDGMLILETHVDMLHLNRPALAFYPDSELGCDPSNWFGPNPAAVVGMLKAVGFEQVQIAAPPPESSSSSGYRVFSGQFKGNPEAVAGNRMIFHAWKKFDPGREQQHDMAAVREDTDCSVTTVEGFKMHLDPADILISGPIMETKNWEPHVTAVFKRELAAKSGGVFLDVGANMGWFALTAAAQPQCAKVIALEPNHGNVQLLYRSMLANHFDKITVYPFAAGDKPTVLRLSSSAGPTGTGFVSPAGEHHDAAVVFVQSMRLDDLLKDERRIDILKMDIDGYEPAVVKGMQRLIARHLPVIFTEFFPKGIRQLTGMEPEAYLEMLGRLGYKYAVIGQQDGKETTCEDAQAVMTCWRNQCEAVGGDHAHLDLVARPTKSWFRRLITLR